MYKNAQSRAISVYNFFTLLASNFATYQKTITLETKPIGVDSRSDSTAFGPTSRIIEDNKYQVWIHKPGQPYLHNAYLYLRETFSSDFIIGWHQPNRPGFNGITSYNLERYGNKSYIYIDGDMSEEYGIYVWLYRSLTAAVFPPSIGVMDLRNQYPQIKDGMYLEIVKEVIGRLPMSREERNI
jgi:hypothetical protein